MSVCLCIVILVVYLSRLFNHLSPKQMISELLAVVSRFRLLEPDVGGTRFYIDRQYMTFCKFLCLSLLCFLIPGWFLLLMLLWELLGAEEKVYVALLKE